MSKANKIYDWLLVVRGRIDAFLPARCAYHEGQRDLIEVIIKKFFRVKVPPKKKKQPCRHELKWVQCPTCKKIYHRYLTGGKRSYDPIRAGTLKCWQCLWKHMFGRTEIKSV